MFLRYFLDASTDAVCSVTFDFSARVILFGLESLIIWVGEVISGSQLVRKIFRAWEHPFASNPVWGNSGCGHMVSHDPKVSLYSTSPCIEILLDHCWG